MNNNEKNMNKNEKWKNIKLNLKRTMEPILLKNKIK